MDFLVLLIYFVGFLLAMFAFGWIKHKINSTLLNREFFGVFKIDDIQTPILKLGSSYSWPTFNITFLSQKEFVYATEHGLIETYKEKLKKRYGSGFDTDLAVYVKY